jgi:hypothetical protein
MKGRENKTFGVLSFLLFSFEVDVIMKVLYLPFTIAFTFIFRPSTSRQAADFADINTIAAALGSWITVS